MQWPQRSVGLLLLLCLLAASTTPVTSQELAANATNLSEDGSHGSHRSHSRHKHHTSIVVTGELADSNATAGPVVAVSKAAAAQEPDAEASETQAADNTTATIAQVLDKALIKEFEQDTKDAESEKGKTFNETVANEEVCTPCASAAPLACCIALHTRYCPARSMTQCRRVLLSSSLAAVKCCTNNHHSLDAPDSLQRTLLLVWPLT